ncbi:MAG: hypothetical protein ABSG53_19135 [Thermoguttaceae bacterium]
MTRFMIAAIVILVVLCAALATTGIVRFQNTKDESGVTIDKKELKEKTLEAVKKSEDASGKILDKTGKVLHKAAEGLRGPSGDRNIPTTKPQLNDKNTRHPDETNQSPKQQG